MSKKIDLGGFVNSLKTMINPEGALEGVDPSDRMGMKIKQVSEMLRELAQRQAQQTDDLTKVHNLIVSLFEDLEQVRNPAEAPAAKPKAKPADDQTEE